MSRPFDRGIAPAATSATDTEATIPRRAAPRRAASGRAGSCSPAPAAPVDQGTKTIAQLSEHERFSPVGNVLGLQLAFNPGTVMSLGSGSTWLLTIIAAAASVALLIAATRARTAGWAVAIGLLWGGAVGNLLDRLLAPPGFGRGHVTDFLAYGNLFIGNLADVILGVGVALGILLYVSQSKGRRSSHQPDEHRSTPKDI